MNDKKNIDRLFQEKFKDFDVTPKDAVWDEIESRLHNEKKERRVIPIWWRVVGIAAALVLMFAVGNIFFNNNGQDIPIIVDTRTPSDPESVITNGNNNSTILNDTDTSIASENNSETTEPNTTSEKDKDIKSLLNKNDANTSVKNYTNAVADKTNNKLQQNKTNGVTTSTRSSLNSNTKTSKVADNSKNNNTPKTTTIKSQSEINKIIKNATKDNTTVVADVADTKEKDTLIYPSSAEKDSSKKDQSIEEAIAEANPITKKEEELNRWSISPNVAPVYFNSLSKGSAIGQQFNANNTASDISMSYGVQGSYTINKRLKVRAGINRVNSNRATEDVLALSGSGALARGATPQIGNITLNSTSESITLLSTANISRASSPQSINTLPTGNLEQRFGFIEVPLELEYRVVDKRLGVSLIGGFSTFFLNENDIFSDIDGTSTLIGESNNLNGTSYSANFGIGVNYNLSKQINLNLEPKFKYLINTFNNTSRAFQPFFIGVYTGLSFKF
jgi:hypothetical protein